MKKSTSGFRRLVCGRLLAALLFCAGFLSGQAQAEERSGEGVSVRAMLLMPAGTHMELSAAAGEKVSKPVLVGARGLSDGVGISGRQFSWVTPEAGAPGGYKILCKVVLPETGGNFITLLEPEEDHFKAHVMNGGDSNFGPDAVAFFNAAREDIGVAMDSKRVLIVPGKPVVVNPPRMAEKPFYQVQMFRVEEGAYQLFASTRWPYRTATRSYVFIYRSQKNGQLAWQAVDEVIR